ncbi:MAG: hypothetical protein A3K67_00310 [Euryarchaeota archaeon RBG_16_62_10]|nr:MAG: hypothetical protein A3K67_00310 [Euryarchaeota archaeon RBG_16_62_10]
MVTYSHAIYIDESGNGAPTEDMHKFWVSVAVGVAFDQVETLNQGVHTILADHFRPFVREIKGSFMPRYMRRSSSIASASADLAGLLDGTGAHCWAVASSYGARSPPGFLKSCPKVKDVVRQLLLERINGLLVSGYHEPDHCLIIWDISDQQELQDFSASIAEFRNAFDGTPRSHRLAPAALGGLSHDWSGLQMADVIAHCALHNLGYQESFPESRREKADAFTEQFLPRLQRSSRGDLVGWKVWK